ncbi:DUF1801 domain-containing protein [Cyclobacterium plantarum]|uniref:DUF1801 domain-containing protein n=1 Tax=Cyclobacterium plantarum TaxID=2716263 RepID=A0ABX0H6A8_9BACT|nr:DUF1801 domain-containing protein [Cyclobacterium plantarum]NHE57343.1 DUF1801 domain-containing protein [Cyclobacterium plantarum]
MSKAPDNIAAYLESVPESRKNAFTKLRNTIINHLPEGFEETISYGMIGYVVPLDKYPKGYHVDPKLPLPFLNLANQKNYIALYHLGLYTNEALLSWFKDEYPKHSSRKLDMGKSCIRFRQPDIIPYELIGQLLEKISLEEWIMSYEKGRKK